MYWGIGKLNPSGNPGARLIFLFLFAEVLGNDTLRAFPFEQKCAPSASYIAKGAHVGNLPSKFLKVDPWISKSRLTDKNPRY